MLHWSIILSPNCAISSKALTDYATLPFLSEQPELRTHHGLAWKKFYMDFNLIKRFSLKCFTFCLWYISEIIMIFLPLWVIRERTHKMLQLGDWGHFVTLWTNFGIVHFQPIFPFYAQTFTLETLPKKSHTSHIAREMSETRMSHHTCIIGTR